VLPEPLPLHRFINGKEAQVNCWKRRIILYVVVFIGVGQFSDAVSADLKSIVPENVL